MKAIFEKAMADGLLPAGAIYEPEKPVLRGELMNLLGVLGDYPEYEAEYPDVTADSPYLMGIRRMAQMEAIHDGVPVRAEAPVTRAETAVLLSFTALGGPMGKMMRQMKAQMKAQMKQGGPGGPGGPGGKGPGGLGGPGGPGGKGPGGPGGPGAPAGPMLRDTADLDPDTADAVETAVRRGAMQAPDGAFRPGDVLTQGELLQLIDALDHLAPEEMPVMHKGREVFLDNNSATVEIRHGDCAVQVNGKELTAPPCSNVVALDYGGYGTIRGSHLYKEEPNEINHGPGAAAVNALVSVAHDSRVEISDCVLESNSYGGTGVYLDGDQSYAYLNRVKIRTHQPHSRGVYTYYNSSVILVDCEVETDMNQCAAVATDTGNGSIAVYGGKYLSHGSGSPACYCTGDIRCHNAHLEATGAEGAVIVGRNTIVLENCWLRGWKQWGLMFHQAGDMPDKQDYCPSFEMTNGRFETVEGPALYYKEVSKEAYVILRNVEMVTHSGILMSYTMERGYGKGPGGLAVLKGYHQKLDGAVIGDRFADAAIELYEGSSMSSAINEKGNMHSVKLSLEKDCTLKLTGDSHITVLQDADKTLSNITGSYTLTYDAAAPENSWLGGQTVEIAGGGRIMPA